MTLGSSEGQIRGFRQLWEGANEKLTPEESSNKFLLTKHNKEQSAWHVVTILCSVRLLKKLLEWTTDRHTMDEIKQTLFLAKHLLGRTACNDAAETKSTELLDVLWELGKEELTTAELSNKLLLAKDDKQKKKRLARDRNNGQHRVVRESMSVG